MERAYGPIGDRSRLPSVVPVRTSILPPPPVPVQPGMLQQLRDGASASWDAAVAGLRGVGELFGIGATPEAKPAVTQVDQVMQDAFEAVRRGDIARAEVVLRQLGQFGAQPDVIQAVKERIDAAKNEKQRGLGGAAHPAARGSEVVVAWEGEDEGPAAGAVRRGEMVADSPERFGFDKFYIYDVSREKKYIIDVPPPDIFPNKNFPTALINDSIFVCGGSTQEIFALRSSFQFNMINLEFVQKKGMLKGRCKHALAVLNPSMIYSLGGARGKAVIRECIKYDLGTDIWGQGPYLNYENCSMAAFSFKSRFVYVIGGMNNSSNEFASEFEKLDTLNENAGWARVNFRSNGWASRYGMNVCQLSDQYFILFGGQSISFQNQSFIFDPEKESLMVNSRMVQGAKFEFQQLMPVLYNDNVYSIDD